MVSYISSTFLANATAICLGDDQKEMVAPESEPVSLGFYTKLTHITDKYYHEKRVEALAAYYNKKLEEYLKKHPRRTVPEALGDPFVYEVVREFMRTDGCNYKNNAEVVKLNRLHLAAKLGITPDVFDANDGFEAYASKKLERYLLLHKHSLVVDEHNKVSLMFKGKMTPWSEILAQKPAKAEVAQSNRQSLAEKLGITPDVFEANEGLEAFASRKLEQYLLLNNHSLVVDANNKVSLMYNGKMTPWSEIPPHKKVGEEEFLHWERSYGKDGVLWDSEYFKFETLEPMFVEENSDEWDNQDVLEICICSSKNSWIGWLTGIHVWFRIKTQEGKIYCLGIYRPEKKSFIDHLTFALRVKLAYFGYEISEYWPFKKGQLRTLEIKIEQEHVTKILEKFAKDAKDPNINFQITNENCVVYVGDLLRDIVGVILPMEQSLYGMFNPDRFKLITNQIPVPVRKVCVAAGAVFVNLLKVVLGAHLVDKNVEAEGVKPIINSFWDLISPEKALVYHPYTVMYKTFDWVGNWRAKDKARLEGLKTGENDADIDKQIKMLRYALPPQSELPSYY
jgi:hypothetical protein